MKTAVESRVSALEDAVNSGQALKDTPQLRPHRRADGIPTRCDITLISPAELKIYHLIGEVEHLGASKALTDCVTLLVTARYKLADHLEGIPEKVPAPDPNGDFRGDLSALINRYSKENGSDTADWILASYLCDCLEAFDKATKARGPATSPMKFFTG